MNNFNEPDQAAKRRLLYPLHRYRGEFSPQHLVFNANLQEFAQRISYICALETNGKLTPFQAYSEVRQLYKRLKKSKKALEIGNASPDADDNPPEEPKAP